MNTVKEGDTVYLGNRKAIAMKSKPIMKGRPHMMEIADKNGNQILIPTGAYDKPKTRCPRCTWLTYDKERHHCELCGLVV